MNPLSHLTSSVHRRHRLVVTTVLAITAITASSALAAFPGENGPIAFERFYKGNEEIFSIDPVSRELTRLTSNALKAKDGVISAADPAYSADGSQIVFVNAVKLPHHNKFRNDVFVMNADGSKPHRITRTDGREVSPAFSPDGSEIAFKRARHVYVIDADGSNEHILSEEITRKAGDPVFSPDGSKVALSVNLGGDQDVVVVDADGSNPVNLTPASDHGDYTPAFSPDGSQIAYVHETVDPVTDLFIREVYVVNVDGSDPHQVSTNGTFIEGDPSFSPDGTQIVYVSESAEKAPTRPFIVGVDGEGTHRLAGGKLNYTYNFDWGISG